MRPFNNPLWFQYLLLILAAVFLAQSEEESTVHICFQDHPGEVSFRNIRIKELD